MVEKSNPMADDDTKAASGARPFDSALAGQIKESAQQIWLAGLGAFARAQAEGSKVFEALVKEGAGLQKKTQSGAEHRLGEVASKLTGLADDVQARAGQQWDKLEGLFEERMARALNRLGVPSAQDVAALNARIDELSAAIAKLSKAAAVKKVRRAPARSAVAKRAAARKPVTRGAQRP